MYGVHVVHPQQIWVQVQSPITSNVYKNFASKARNCPTLQLDKTLFTSSLALSQSTLHHNSRNQKTHFCVNASSASVGSTEYTVEPATKVAFQTSLNLPGCSSPLTLLGTGVREKVFAIVGVKVYAAGLYANPSIITKLESDAKTQGDPSLFSSIFQSPSEKSLQIVLVRDVDGKTFWDALDGAISPRIRSPTLVDESALSAFRSLFQGRSLKKGTFIILTWIDTSKMLVSVSPDGVPSSVDVTIESGNVTSSLFDVFFGDAPVSPSLKASVANGLATILN